MKGLMAILLLVFMGCSNLPKNISMESKTYKTNNVEFYYDLTYKKDGVIYTEHRLFDQMAKMIKEADKFIVMDVFLFNDLYNSDEYKFPNVTKEITDALIEKKKENKDIKIYFLTDQINTFYGVYTSKELERMKDNGITVVMTDLKNLKGANRVYSGIWKGTFSWFGTKGYGWMPNPFSKYAPKVTMRSYLKLINLKGNHRKVVVTDKNALITSANPHNASGYHSNIGFKFDGPAIDAVLESEKAVAMMSNVKLDIPEDKAKDKGQNINNKKYLNKETNNINSDITKNIEEKKKKDKKQQYKVQVITEGKIGKTVDQDIEETVKDDEVYIGMFYLGDVDIVKELIKASKRGVNINIILDQNKEAFGMKKSGIPNKVTAKKLIDKTNGNIKIRWYNTSGEQYHTKLTLIKKSNKVIINGGSANMTKRNMRDFTLDTNVRVEAPKKSVLAKDVEKYFEILWGNKDGEYTIEIDNLDEDSWSNLFFYKLQNISGFSTF